MSKSFFEHRFTNLIPNNYRFRSDDMQVAVFAGNGRKTTRLTEIPDHVIIGFFFIYQST